MYVCVYIHTCICMYIDSKNSTVDYSHNILLGSVEYNILP